MNDNKNPTVEIIGYDSGWGCGDYGCEDGPHAIAADQLLHTLGAQGLKAIWRGPLGLKHLGSHSQLNTKSKTLPLVEEGARRLSHATCTSVENGHTPFVIGGDHSSAFGTWPGVIAAKNAVQDFGLIWIDAHLDSHTPETAWQGKFGGWWHGMPIAALTGKGDAHLVSIMGAGAKIDPKHIVIIGAHSYEPAEKEFIEKNGIRVYTLMETQERGFAKVFTEALDKITNETKNFGISIDMDAFRPEDAPGVGAAENRGLVAENVLPALKGVGRHKKFAALEIVELNPHKDINGKTSALLEKIAHSIFS